MTYPLVHTLTYNRMIEWGYNVILREEVDVSFTNTYTRKLLKHLNLITGSLHEKSPPISLEDYIKAVRRLRESTSSGSSIVTPYMVKTEVTYPELRELGWRRLNPPWCTCYSSKRYRIGLDILIHKDPNDFRSHRLRTILLFNI